MEQFTLQDFSKKALRFFATAFIFTSCQAQNVLNYHSKLLFSPDHNNSNVTINLLSKIENKTNQDIYFLIPKHNVVRLDHDHSKVDTLSSFHLGNIPFEDSSFNFLENLPLVTYDLNWRLLKKLSNESVCETCDLLSSDKKRFESLPPVFIFLRKGESMTFRTKINKWENKGEFSFIILPVNERVFIKKKDLPKKIEGFYYSDEFVKKEDLKFVIE